MPNRTPTTPDRRRLLRQAGSLGLWSLASSVPLMAAVRTSRVPTALLLPLTGPSANLGSAMARAASLVTPADAKVQAPAVFDTTPGAALAARAAVRHGARLIAGPLFAGEVRPVLTEVAGRVPVVTFSNDAGLLDSGAFVLGITAAQQVGAILRYGRQRGLRRIGLLAGTDGWSAQVAAAMRQLQGELGFEMVPMARPAGLSGLAVLLVRMPGGAPDALLVPDATAGFTAAARALAGSGVQLLGLTQAVDYAPAALAAAAGAWIAAPDPAAFATFAAAYQARHGGVPGTIAALAYDAAGMIAALRTGDRVSRAGLLALEPYRGVTGTLKFRSDGSCVRDLAILIATPDGYQATTVGTEA